MDQLTNVCTCTAEEYCASPECHGATAEAALADRPVRLSVREAERVLWLMREVGDYLDTAWGEANNEQESTERYFPLSKANEAVDLLAGQIEEAK